VVYPFESVKPSKIYSKQLLTIAWSEKLLQFQRAGLIPQAANHAMELRWFCLDRDQRMRTCGDWQAIKTRKLLPHGNGPKD